MNDITDCKTCLLYVSVFLILFQNSMCGNMCMSLSFCVPVFVCSF